MFISVISLFFLSYEHDEWVPTANVDIFKHLEVSIRVLRLNPGPPGLEGECSNHWAKVWSHTILLQVLHL